METARWHAELVFSGGFLNTVFVYVGMGTNLSSQGWDKKQVFHKCHKLTAP